MSDPKRLLESSPNPLTRELLRAGIPDAPDPRTLPRLLGAAGSLATFGASTAAASGFGAIGQAGTVGFAAKWVGIGLLAGLVTGGGVTVVAMRAIDSHPAAPPTSSAFTPAPIPAPSRAKPAIVPRAAESPVAPLNEASPRQVPTDRNGPAGAPGGLDRSRQLAADVAVIDRAKRSLGRGDAAGTLRELDAYAKSANTGVLDREALVLKVEALVLAGKQSEAREVARSYLERFNEDAYTRRLRQLVDSERKAGPK